MRVTIELPDDFIDRFDKKIAGSYGDAPDMLRETVEAITKSQQAGDVPHIFVTFEASLTLYESGLRKDSEPEAVTVGPFNWVQLTYAQLRFSPDGDHLAAYMDAGGGLWHISDNLDKNPKWLIRLLAWSPMYSDIIIHRNPPTQEFPQHRVILTNK